MIEFQNVTKLYGETIGLDDFSLSVSEPGIHCLLGRNGAGKTTLMKLLAGHIDASSGNVSVDDKEVSLLDMPDNVHYVESGATQFNVKLETLFEYAKSVNPKFDTSYALKMAERFDLDLRKRYKQLSFGMKTMVNTLISVSSGKDILLLDEPILGFDPIMRKTFYDLLSESCAESPKIVIVSTHIIDEIEKIAGRLIVIDEGQLELFCDMADIGEKAYLVVGSPEHVIKATEGLRIFGETMVGGLLSRQIYDRRIPDSDKYTVSQLNLQDFFVGLVDDKKKGK